MEEMPCVQSHHDLMPTMRGCGCGTDEAEDFFLDDNICIQLNNLEELANRFHEIYIFMQVSSLRDYYE